MVPSQAGGLDTVGTVGAIAFPQVSFTRGGDGTTMAHAHAAVELDGASEVTGQG